MSDARVKFLLDEDRIPTAWYNIVADLPEPPAAVLHPGTGQPIGPDDLAPLFPMALIGQEVSAERYIDIPGEIIDIYRQWRPSPLFRARRLEKALGTPARIYYKYEGVSPAGSHKPNTAIPQAYYNKKEGVKRLSTETGAGQWGSSLALACSFFDLECQVFMVKVSYNQKPYRRAMMETFGASVVASPSMDTESGRAILKDDPECRGSLGIAISVLGTFAIGWGFEDNGDSSGNLLGGILATIGAIGLAVYLLIGRNLRRRHSLGVYVTVCYGAAAGYLCLAAIGTGQQVAGFSPSIWWCVVGLALVSQILGHTTNNWALRFFSASMIAVALLGEPICSTLLAYFFFDETLTAVQFGGAALILAGIYFAARAERR